ncbi:MAG: PQQ-binding-like beta-propeller repeat protein [Verrucomicrobiae bacterium]|nr:PQQ-binding-like beta-propeller repeat protein [Verrucomicrobiae bacterium]
MRPPFLPTLLALAFLAFPLARAEVAATTTTHPWPQFRGPGGNGVASADGVPVKWSETENLAWKTELPGKGWSSPVVTAGGKIWLTTAIEVQATDEEKVKLLTEAGEDPKQFKSRQIAKNVILQALEVDLETGRLERRLDLITVENPDAIHALNSYASPTPVLEGDRLYCHFGTFGTVCLDTATGGEIWRQRFPLVHNVGPGSSPHLDGDRLILICDGVDTQYVTALDKRSGDVLWRTDRPAMRAEKGDQKKAYCTPISLTDRNGRAQVVCMGSQWLVSYDPATGRELWRLDHGNGFSVVPRPVYDPATGLVIFATGFGKPQLWAVDPTGSGDITQTDLVRWKEAKRGPAKPSPLVVGAEVYVMEDGGIASCLDAATGAVHWSERAGGNYSASPLHADGKIYFCSQEGKVTVIAPGQTWQVLAENQLDGQLMASPVALDGTLLIRSDTALYRVK